MYKQKKPSVKLSHKQQKDDFASVQVMLQMMYEILEAVIL